jgi:Na+-translocating ferredoxin:NAD+ oxidoreductase RnfC subunit
MVMDALVTAVRDAGVVGAGGAGFPTHVKLAAQVECIIVNGAECEPLLHVDQELAKAYAPELVEALRACVSSTGASAGIFALKEKYREARGALTAAVAGQAGLSVFALENSYPAGDEHVLVHEVTGRVVPEGGIPLNVGIVVLNVETLHNIWSALQGQPVTDTFVTVCGEVKQPATLRLAVGTSIADALAAAGGVTCENPAIIHGGPVMGSLVESTEAPVTKTTKGLVALPMDHPHVRRMRRPVSVSLERAITACCQCRQCSDLCPRALLGHNIAPHKIMRAAGYALTKDPAVWTAAFLCSECGVCDTFACGADLSPRQVYRSVKAQLAAAGVKNPHKATPTPLEELVYRRVPTERLIWRMGLEPYVMGAPLIREVLLPAVVKVPLKQNAGAASVPVVKVGERVSRGQLVAEPPPDALGARHHASVTGTVTAVGNEVSIKREA